MRFTYMHLNKTGNLYSKHCNKVLESRKKIYISLLNYFF